MPVAAELRAAFSGVLDPWRRPTGRPTKIVEPATAPSNRICDVLTCKGHLTDACRCKATLTRPISIVETVAGHSVDEYLETIYFLAFPIGEYRPATGSTAIAARVAEMLGVSRASAGEMLKRLEADGLVERGDQKEALLTSAGIERARGVVRKHRIIERFLTDFMGYTAAESHVHADELGDTFTDEMIERINARLGSPERCPHGWPVEPEVEQAENADLLSLA